MSVYNSAHTGAQIDTAASTYQNSTQVSTAINSTINSTVPSMISNAVNPITPYFLVDTTVAIADWESDSTYTAYPYRATISDARLTANTYCEVVFSLADATSGYFAPVCESVSGGLYIYASSIPLAAITIPTIKCTENVAAS